MLSNVELSERKRLIEEQQKVEAVNEATRELVVIAIDFRAQTRQAIVAVVERLRHTRFRGWQDVPTARVELNDPLSGKEASYETKIEYVVSSVDKMAFHEVIEHLLRLTRALPLESRVIVTMEGSGVGRNVLPLTKQYVKSVIPLNVTEGGRTEKKNGEYYVSLDRLNAHMNEMLASGELKLKEDSPESSASIAYGIFIATRSKSIPIANPGTVKTRW